MIAEVKNLGVVVVKCSHKIVALITELVCVAKIMKTRRILMWHGRMPEVFLNKLESFCDSQDESYTYTGTLDDFEQKWGGNFMVLGEFIAVTHYTNFNPR